MPACPSCRRDAAPSGDNRFFPFCSERCKALDLGRWFGGAYRVPAEPISPEELPTRSAEDDADDEAPAPVSKRPPARRRS